MAESLNLTSPIIKTITSYIVRRLDMDLDAAYISIRLKGTDGKSIELNYEGSIATTLIIALNKTNLSINSLQRRILERLVIDGKLPLGTVIGSPD